MNKDEILIVGLSQEEREGWFKPLIWIVNLSTKNIDFHKKDSNLELKGMMYRKDKFKEAKFE